MVELRAADLGVKPDGAAQFLNQALGLFLSPDGVPLYFRGPARPVRMWLESLSTGTLAARPLRWVTYARTLRAAHRNTRIDNKLEAAAVEPDDYIRGYIAAIRAMDAAIHYESETIVSHSIRACSKRTQNRKHCHRDCRVNQIECKRRLYAR